MRVGIPKEVKEHEYRVGATPSTVRDLTRLGHNVFIETGAGIGSAFDDLEYEQVGATIVGSADELWGEAEIVVKVKEPIREEWHRLRSGQVLFTYLHLAADPQGTQAILNSGAVAIAYETVRTPDGGLPLLAPMSEVAGKLAPQVGAYHLMRSQGGRGLLPGGVPGVEPARVVIIGGGVAGTSAAVVAVGMGADVTVLDTNLERLRQLDSRFGGRVKTVASSVHAIERLLPSADLVVGAVLIPGAKAPTLVSRELVEQLQPGTILVDVAVDQGGCFEDTRPTTHREPTYTVHESLFYCVANMPGAVPRSSTIALSNVTAPYLAALANLGWERALSSDSALAHGLNAVERQLTNPEVGRALGIPSVEPTEVIVG